MFTSRRLSRAALLLAVARLGSLPAYGIVIAGLQQYNPVVSYGEPVDGVNMSGVVEVTGSTGDCSGSLLMDGVSILTAGHCVTTQYGAPIAADLTVTFMGPNGAVTDAVASVSVDPGYTGDPTQGDDLAVLRLSAPAPAFATGYQLFEGTPTIAPDVMAGYGVSGTGATGANGAYGTLEAGENAYVVTGAWFGYSSTLLIGEFYESNAPSTNALGISDPNPYDAADEVDISPGDSGGPSFYDGELVGVHDLGICLTAPEGSSVCAEPPSVGPSNDSYFGQMYADVSVSANATWIEDQEVPEPLSAALAGLGLGALAWARRRVFRARPGRIDRPSRP